MQISAWKIRENRERVREAVAAACGACGRAPDAVRIVAVTKYVDAATAKLLVDAGEEDLGENRPQQLDEKRRILANQAIRWHLIGHLQRNKVRLAVPACSLIHSVDSLQLLQSIDSASRAASVVSAVLLEVNISGEGAKQGFSASQLPGVLEKAAPLSGLRIQGLMAMSGLDCGPAEARRQFDAVRELRDRMTAAFGPSFDLAELSMGMSGDYSEAIAAGATLVRIGSRFFEP